MTPVLRGLEYFSSLAPSHIKMGLGRVLTALETLGHPERRVKAIHVAGTNGKGSTCAFLASCLSRRYRVGLYTSPHLVTPNERIQIDGVPIDDATFARRIDEVNDRLGPHELTYFEFGTVVAFWHFAHEALDVAVIETGLGGRLDATTACVPLVTCITPIDFDHMEYLGHTLEAIGREKAGILKPDVPAVFSKDSTTAMLQPGALEGRDFSIQAQADGSLEWRSARRTLGGLRPGLRGRHQHQNLALALACLDALGPELSLTDDEVRQGVAAARWPGRLEEFPGSPPVVLDGAHNPSGVRVLLDAFDDVYPGREVHLVFGVFADKDSEPMMRALFPRVAAVHLAPIASPRSKDPASYEAFARGLNSAVSRHASAEAALEAARASAPPGAIVVVAGSLFLIGQLRRVLAR